MGRPKIEVLAVLSRGGFGRVEKVRLPDGRLAARKVFDPDRRAVGRISRGKLRDRFAREVRVQGELSSDHFMPVLAVHLARKEPWFAMPLAKRIYTQQIAIDRAAGAISLAPLADILNGLEELHALGYVHRDLKPANILLHGNRWKLADFGLVLPPSGDATTRLTTTGAGWGSAAYCAPEQAHSFRTVTAAADIYAFGCILHDLATDGVRVPYQRHSCEGDLGLVIEKCTEIEPAKRWRSIAGLRAALFEVLASPPRPRRTPTAREWAARLADPAAWDEKRLADFVRFLDRGASGATAVLVDLAEETIEAFYRVDPSLADQVARHYTAFAARVALPFEFCDVVIRRLEAFWGPGDLGTKASVALAAARLGANHDRWFVMKRLNRLCGAELEDPVARRIAIEIRAEEAQAAFRACAAGIPRRTAAFHPLIRGALRGPF